MRKIIRRAAQRSRGTQGVAASETSELHQIVAGLSEGVILINPDQTIRWANAAALALHGASSIADLGVDIDAYRRRFTLSNRDNSRLASSKTPIERVVAGEAVHDVVVEVGKAGAKEPHWIHRIRSLVLQGEDGHPSCLVLIITDLTEEVEAEERFERSFGANPAPAAICQLNDLRFVRANEGFLELTGYRQGDVIGRSVYEIDVLHRADRREFAIERLKLGAPIPQMEACLKVPADSEKWVIVAGQPIDMPGDVPCMLFTFADLEARRRAETDLKQSQELIAKSFQLIPIPIVRWRRGMTRISAANDAFLQLFGVDQVEVDADNDLMRALWCSDAERRAFEKEIAGGGRVRNVEHRLRARDGREVLCVIFAEAAIISREAWVVAVFQDVSGRRRTETELAAAIEAAMPDASEFSRKVMDKLATQRGAPQATSGGGLETLTERERQILIMVAHGTTDAAISMELKLSPNTVRNHLAALYRKIGVNRRSAAIVFARERGLTSLKDI